MESLVGSEIEAVTLTLQSENHTEALTDNYQKLKLAGRHDSNHLIRAHVQAVDNDALVGRVIS
jgi:hypothetical protein